MTRSAACFLNTLNSWHRLISSGRNRTSGDGHVLGTTYQDRGCPSVLAAERTSKNLLVGSASERRDFGTPNYFANEVAKQPVASRRRINWTPVSSFSQKRALCERVGTNLSLGINADSCSRKSRPKRTWPVETCPRPHAPVLLAEKTVQNALGTWKLSSATHVTFFGWETCPKRSWNVKT